MKAVVQRVLQCSVTVKGEVTGTIGPGLLVLLGVAVNDSESQADWLFDKIINLRIFEDDAGKMNRSLLDTGGSMMVVSQFTVQGDCRKGRRPSFSEAAGPEMAEALYDYFVGLAQHSGIETATGRFRAMMQVALINDGPVTLIVERPANNR